jgi:hypothetical protein
MEHHPPPEIGECESDAAVAVLQNVNNNLKIVEERSVNWQSKKKFQTGDGTPTKIN